jgi:hypothetical protein
MSKSFLQVLWSSAISQVPSIREPSSLKEPVKRWENSNGEKSGLGPLQLPDAGPEAHLVDARDATLVEIVLEESPAARVPAEERQPVRRFGDRSSTRRLANDTRRQWSALDRSYPFQP